MTAVPYKSTRSLATTTQEVRRKKGGTGLNDLFIAVFAVAFLVSVSLNVLHLTGGIEHSHNTALHQDLHDFKTVYRRHDSWTKSDADEIKPGKLSCEDYGGPSDPSEMIYWHVSLCFLRTF